MKKQVLFLAALVGFTSAKGSSEALGFRFAGGNATGAEFSWLHGMGAKNRLEFDLGLYNSHHASAFSLTGIYQWKGPISGGFGWFVGPGANLSYWSWDNGYYKDNDHLSISIGGQAGLEYDFNKVGAPFQLSLDIRPMVGVFGGWGNGYDGALGLRYTF